MATLKDYYETDFQVGCNFNKLVLTGEGGARLEVLTRIHQDFDSNTKYVSYYVPSDSDTFTAIVLLVNGLDKALNIGKGIETQVGFPGEKLRTSEDLQFSGRLFFYCESQIDVEQFEILQNEVKSKGLFLHYRGPEYVQQRSRVEKPRAFISHDSLDKDDFARPIALGLSKLACPVWFDEYSLKVGDSLRESIEKGIKECEKCILILSPKFLANSGWTKVEFNSIFTREVLEKKNIVLPVWCGINKNELFEYCPSLVDKVGVKIDLGLDEVIRQLYRAITV